MNMDRNAAIGYPNMQAPISVRFHEIYDSLPGVTRSGKNDGGKRDQRKRNEPPRRNPRKRSDLNRIIHRDADNTANATKNMRLSQISDTTRTSGATHRQQKPEHGDVTGHDYRGEVIPIKPTSDPATMAPSAHAIMTSARHANAGAPLNVSRNSPRARATDRENRRGMRSWILNPRLDRRGGRR